MVTRKTFLASLAGLVTAPFLPKPRMKLNPAWIAYRGQCPFITSIFEREGWMLHQQDATGKVVPLPKHIPA